MTRAALGTFSGMTTVAELLIDSLADYGVTTVWGVVGDALNPVTDAIRREDRVEWIGVRHEEVGAFAASAQAQLTGKLAVCMGTVGPGAVHLLNGLYDAKKSHAPVLAICGQVPREEMGSEFFQEVDNDALFADVAVFNRTVTSLDQLPQLIEQAGNAAIQDSGVAVLTLPGDVGGLDLPKRTAVPVFIDTRPRSMPAPDVVQEAASLLNQADKVTLLVGQGAREARDEVLQLAERLAAPMVLTLKAKEGLEQDNPYEVGQSGLLGNHADGPGVRRLRRAVPRRHRLPLPGLPADRQVGDPARRARVAHRSSYAGGPRARRRRAPSDCRRWCRCSSRRPTGTTSPRPAPPTRSGASGRPRFTDPSYDTKPRGLLRRKVDNPDSLIRPELLAATLDRHAAHDAVFTTDTGMATVWLSRFVRMNGSRRLIGSFNLGSMANAMPQALGASALDRRRQVVAFCGDGGLSMLMGDLITAVTYDLPVKLVVFDNGRLGMVKLEMEQVGLPEYGTVLRNPDFARVAEAIGMRGIRVERPGDVDAAVKEALAHEGPVLLDVVTNPDEIAIPPSPTLEQGWGFAIAKMKESVDSAE